MYSAYFIKRPNKANPPFKTLWMSILRSFDHIFNVIGWLKIDEAQRPHYWTLDVRCSTFNLFSVVSYKNRQSKPPKGNAQLLGFFRAEASLDVNDQRIAVRTTPRNAL